MADFYFTTGSNSLNPHLQIRIVNTDLGESKVKNYFYSLPLSSIKFTYLIDSTSLTSTSDTSTQLFIHDLYKENVEIIMDTSTDNIYINGTQTFPNPQNSFGLYNQFTSSNYI